MARRGAMAKNPPLRGKARQEFKQAKREAVASGGEMPTQAQFRPKPQPRPQPQPQQPIAQMPSGVGQGAGQSGQQIQDYMLRFQQPVEGGAALEAAMSNIPGSRSEGSPVFNAFPGNNPANMNQNNYGMFDSRRPQVMPEQGLIQDAMFRSPGVPMQNIPGMEQGFQNGLGNFTQMPQPSANNGGKYRLSPGVYGTKEQAMKQFENQWNRLPAMPMQRKG